MSASRIRTILEMIKFEHSIFALPFALTGALLAARYAEIPEVAAGWPTLKIESGTIDITSLHLQPFGVGFIPDVEQFQLLEDWRSQPSR